MQEAREIIKKIVREFFKNDYGEPLELTNGQADIVLCIFTKKHPRNQIIATTQYGKSTAVAIALILRSITFKESWAVVSGQQEKAMIIMSSVIQHTFDHPRFYSMLDLDKTTPMERLKRERSKDRITWLYGGGIRTFTANARNKSTVKEALTGFGSPNVVEDEASLVPDDVQSMVMRMLGGHKDNFLLKIGNPFYNNHFKRSWLSDRYHKIFIDYKQAMEEGRLQSEFVEEMRNELFFDVLYECKFPNTDDISGDGWRRLFPDELLQNAFITEEEFQEAFIKENLASISNKKLGCDFAGGGADRSAYIARWGNYMKKLSTNRNADTMSQIPIIENYKDEYGFNWHDISIDIGGLGKGIGDRMHEKEEYVSCIMFGESAVEKERFRNMRSYMYYELFMWLKNGGKIVKDDDFNELLYIYYKEDSEKKLLIQSKEDLKKKLKQANLSITSPDVADGAALTFAAKSDIIGEDDFEFV